MPVSKEELERLLEKHREDRKQLLDMEAKNSLSHAQKIKQKLAEKLMSRNASNREESKDRTEVGDNKVSYGDKRDVQ